MYVRWGVSLLVLVLGMVPAFFNSCSPSHDSSFDSNSFSKGSCGDMSELYSRSYYPFLKKECSSCHVAGGLGKGSFADNNFTVAWRSFEVTGFSLIGENAINPSHQSPYTGPQNSSKINELKEVWIKGLEEAQIECGDSNVLPEIEDLSPRIKTKSKGINADFNSSEPFIMTWDLEKELLPSSEIEIPTLPGAILEVKVSVIDVLGVKSYLITEPRIKNSSVDIHLRSLKFHLNGSAIKGNTTFNNIDEMIRNGTSMLLSTGTNVVAAEVSYSDVISVSFAELEIPSEPIPAPSVGPKVSFELASSSVLESVSSTKVRIVLSEPSTKYVTVSFRVNAQTTSSSRCCIDNFLNFNQDRISIDRFDWDYKISNLSVIIEPGQLFKDINIEIANDQRDEGASELLVLDLDANGTANAQLGTITRHTKTILDDDDPYLGAALTMTQLLRPGGILYVNCLGCHNSVDNEGGYDITNWQLLIDNRILIPYDINSKAFVRMNSESPEIPPMPFTGLLETEKRRAVQDWIMSGAQNN